LYVKLKKIFFFFKPHWETAHTETFSWEKTLPVFKSNLNYFLGGTYDSECQLGGTSMFSVIKPHSATYGRFIGAKKESKGRE